MGILKSWFGGKKRGGEGGGEGGRLISLGLEKRRLKGDTCFVDLDLGGRLSSRSSLSSDGRVCLAHAAQRRGSCGLGWVGLLVGGRQIHGREEALACYM